MRDRGPRPRRGRVITEQDVVLEVMLDPSLDGNLTNTVKVTAEQWVDGEGSISVDLTNIIHLVVGATLDALERMGQTTGVTR